MHTSRFAWVAAFGLLSIGLSGCAVAPYGVIGCGATCGVGPACGGCVEPCEPACGCEPDCGCEPGCACEPACGCGTECGSACGRSWAFKKWCDGCRCDGPQFTLCTGPECCGSCDPGCGCEPACGCEPGCGCEPTCGCGAGCYRPGCAGRAVRTLGFGLRCIRDEVCCLFRPLGACYSCGGCDKELYWNEWCNDPPRCCDPCNECGEWVGPTVSRRRPSEQFAPRRVANGDAAGPLPKLR